MGGLHSGRKRTHVCMDDCLDIDLVDLNRQKWLKQTDIFVLTWRKYREINFSERRIQEHQIQVWFNLEKQTMTLKYQIDQGEQLFRHVLTLERSTCNYGGYRWWFRAPCCGRRVRTLYLNPKCDLEHFKPQCRHCQDLHYASQMASYIERHVTYEKHLLANYGYYYAFDCYHSLKQRYFKPTPEYEYKARRSKLERELELMRHFIRSNRMILRTHTRTLRSLKSEEDRVMYMAHIIKEHGRVYASDLVSLLRCSVEMERKLFEASDEVLERFYASAPAQLLDDDYQDDEHEEKDDEHSPLKMHNLLARKRRLQQQLEELDELAIVA